MAVYISVVNGPVPAGLSVHVTAQNVYNLLINDPRAVHDLSLPPVASWAAPVGLITVNMVQLPAMAGLELSTTEVNLNNTVTSTIRYVAADLNCIPILQGRLTHELTHAIRSAIAIGFNAVVPVGVPLAPICTPDKSAHQRHFRSAGLFGLVNPHFCSGYWSEHILYGGVVVFLANGVYRTVQNGTPSALLPVPADGLYVKVRNTGGQHVVGEHPLRSHFGWLFDPITGTFINDGGALTTIQHCGRVVTRGGNGYHHH